MAEKSSEKAFLLSCVSQKTLKKSIDSGKTADFTNDYPSILKLSCLGIITV